MGKVHRIKKHFWRLMRKAPLEVGVHRLAKTTACLYIGKRRDGSFFLMQYSSHPAYRGLLNQLIKDYESGGSSSDTALVHRASQQ